MSNYNSGPISQLQPGAQVLGSDLYPATDVTDSTPTHPTGFMKKYSISQLTNYIATELIINIKDTVLVATTGNLSADYTQPPGVAPGIGATLTNNSALIPLTIDGVSLAIGDRVLVTFQANPIENGIYTLTTLGTNTIPWVLTRAIDYTGVSPNPVLFGDVVPVISGTMYALTFWFQTGASPLVVGTDLITFQLQTFANTENWVNATTNTAMAVNTGYTNDGGFSTLDYSLPLSAPAGSWGEINGLGVGGFTISQAAGQQIVSGTASTTIGVAGSVASADQFTNIRWRCLVADTVFSVTSFNGSLNYF